MSTTDLPRSAQRVQTAAVELGLDIDIAAFPEGTRTADDAARAVGCAVDQIVKSMIFAADDAGIVLALTSGANQVDPERLAMVAGAARCGRADPEQVRAVTGYAIGGVAPIGHNEPVPTFVDPHLLAFGEVWAAAGTPRHVFPIAPTRLVEVTGAVAAAFTR
ncbi:MAG: YbaK/EbsC family protein [Actinomycetota bacterium]